MLKQTERLKIIYQFLKQNPTDAVSLLDYLKNNNAEISLRQLQRDIIDVEHHFLQENEKLSIKIEQHRKKVWQIVAQNKQNYFNQNTINTLYLSILVSPNVLIKNRLNDIKIVQKLIEKTINENENYITINQRQTQLINTHFYEVTKDVIFDNNIDDLIGAVTNRRNIKIIELINDYTVDNHLFKEKIFDFSPVQILYHRGTFLIAGVENTKQEVVIYEIGQLKKFQLLDYGYNYQHLSKKINTELSHRFGITKNINNEVYDIVLEFTSVTGALVSKFFWHRSQRFEKKKGNWIMTLQCGINRELIGWLFQ